MTRGTSWTILNRKLGRFLGFSLAFTLGRQRAAHVMMLTIDNSLKFLIFFNLKINYNCHVLII
jgi:hypothetical protein